MQVIHVVRDLDIASGGPSRSVPALAEHQARTGAAVAVVYRDRGNTVVSLCASAVDYRPVRTKLVKFAKFVGTDSARQVLHIHGLWDPLLHGSASWARRNGLPYLVSTRGMLADWALGHKAWKKRLAWRLYQRRDLRSAACLVGSSAFEQHDVAALMPGSRVEVITNGCEAPPASDPGAYFLPGDAGVRWALAMGRLHPVKGYAELISAWAALRPRGWRLAVAGPDEDGYRSELENRIASHGLGAEVLLLGEVGDDRKWNLLEQCELFLAPSRTENFGMAIAEALQSGTPVITTTGTPWQEIAERGCGWWAAPDLAALTSALGEATDMDAAELARMGQRGRSLIEENYSWTRVASRSLDLYESILTRTI